MLQARIDPTRARYYRQNLRCWFHAYGHDLLWRRTRDPYRILVSEIMLHQTQVSQATQVYEEFLDRFPTIRQVAQALRRDVKAVTDPLGYKVRGSWLKRIADYTVEYRDGRLPDTNDELTELPGVWRYTAGAIMTFAYDRPIPIVDTNVARVLSRWFAGSLPKRDTDTKWQNRLWALAAAILPARDG